MTTVYDMTNVSLYQVRLDQKDYRSVKKFDELYESYAKSSDNFTHY